MTLLIVLIVAVVLALATGIFMGVVNGDFGVGFVAFVVAFIVLFVAGGFIGSVVDAIRNECTVEVVTAEAEITHLDITESDQNHSPVDTKYRVSFVGEDFATVINVKPEVYARLKVGDIITVEVTTTHNTVYDDEVSYEIVN